MNRIASIGDLKSNYCICGELSCPDNSCTQTRDFLGLPTSPPALWSIVFIGKCKVSADLLVSAPKPTGIRTRFNFNSIQQFHFHSPKSVIPQRDEKWRKSKSLKQCYVLFVLLLFLLHSFRFGAFDSLVLLHFNFFSISFSS